MHQKIRRSRQRRRARFVRCAIPLKSLFPKQSRQRTACGTKVNTVTAVLHRHLQPERRANRAALIATGVDGMRIGSIEPCRAWAFLGNTESICT